MDITDILKWDATLEVGDRVEVRWTNSGLHYREPGTVSKLNECSVRVAIDNDVLGHWSRHDADGVLYPAGFVASVPRCTFRSVERWTWNNGVFPRSDEPCSDPQCGVVGGRVDTNEWCAQCKARDAA